MIRPVFVLNARGEWTRDKPGDSSEGCRIRILCGGLTLKPNPKPRFVIESKPQTCLAQRRRY